jgi:TonB family protein
MEFPGKKLLKILVEHDPASAEFRDEVRAAFRRRSIRPSVLTAAELSSEEFGMWRDVFVRQELPWGRFLQSALLHATAIALIWTLSLALIRQQKILDRAAFDRSSLVTYSPQEYLPPLDTGATKTLKAQKGDPAYAKQPILSVPAEADNRSQTIVAPPDLKLDHDVAMPNMVATGAVVPAVPLDATRAPMTRMIAPETQVVAPAPEVQFAQERVVRSAMKSDVISPPPEMTQSTKGHVGLMNIGPSDVVAPAPQLTLAEQHTATRGKGRVPSGGIQPVGPPPSVAGSGSSAAGGRLVALGIHPVAPNGPVAVPAGNRRGAFAATPQGKPGASGTPELTAGGRGDGAAKTRNGSLPAGLHVGAGDAGGREMARLSSSSLSAATGAHDASVVPSDKATDLDRQVFGDKIFHSMALNMPNLNSATGSWVIHFAELDAGKKEGELTAPRSTEKSDPGYPLELIRANVHGMVSLYAVIDANGKVTRVRVLNSPDDRLDSYAAKALSMCKFQPAERAGKAVALEAVVMIPFRVKRSF